MTVRPRGPTVPRPQCGAGIECNVVWLKLGRPSRETYSGNEKTIHYDGLGLSLRLSLFKVRTIEVHKGGTVMGYVSRGLWGMLP